MHHKHLASLFPLALLMAMTVDVAAQEQDSPDTADHPLVSRYAGSFIDGQQVRDFAAYTLPTGPAVKDAQSQVIPAEKISLEGKITRTLYRVWICTSD